MSRGTASLRSIAPAEHALRGSVRLPGDKSIAHRAVMFNAAAEGRAIVRGLPDGADVASTIAAMRSLGASLERDGEALRIEGTGLHFVQPTGAIDCGNSGTTMRLLMGLLAGAGIDVVLDGDASLRRRPMERLARRLRAMGARVECREGRAPVILRPARLEGATTTLEVASAQMKSSILLAGLSARGRTEVSEPAPSRDHTERMLTHMGVVLSRAHTTVSLSGPAVPKAVDVEVGGDPSSAAFFTVAAAIVPGSEMTIEGIGVNPTRIGFVGLLERMGCDIRVEPIGDSAGEPIGRLCVRGSRLHGIDIGVDDVPSAIDELPVLAVAAAVAAGVTRISGASELRMKESDRVATVVALLRTLGAQVTERADGMEITGGRLVGGVRVDPAGDHRLVMSAAVAALVCERPVEILGADAVAISYPGFFDDLEGVTR